MDSAARTVLGGVSLGYQLLWGRSRQLRGVQLFIGDDDARPVDAAHLLAALDESWSRQAPELVLSIPSPRLLADVLACAAADSPWLEVHATQLFDPDLAQHVRQAHRRGLKLIWRGEPGTRPSPELAPCFARQMVGLTALEALAGLRVSLRRHHGADAGLAGAPDSPVRPGQIYEALASRALAEHCLDEQGAWALADWPQEDVLYGYRQRRIQPEQHALLRLIETIDADDAMDRIEQGLSEEPILVYRFLRYANSAAIGLGKEIESIRHALMLLGLAKLRSWLQEQLPRACGDMNLRPVRAAMVLRARLMAQLLDAGAGDALRREVFLCGLLSQMDLLLGEPLGDVLARVPLPQRITVAILGHGGPYRPSLEVASALASPATDAIRALCERHGMDREDVNRALLRTLAQARPPPVTGAVPA